MEKDDYLVSERELIMRDLTVTKIAEGLGWGVGKISVKDRLDDPADPLTPEILQKTERIIDSDDILVPVDTDDDGQPVEDDGCGDGRPVKRIFRGLKQLKRSLHRVKVFGGGATMTAAAEIGLGHASDNKLGQVFSQAISKLKSLDIHFGAHTDAHAEGKDGGCGAIDNAPQIVANSVKFEDNIRSAINLLNEDEFDENDLDAVFGSFSNYSKEAQSDDYSGRQVLEEILEKNKVVKELHEDHYEVAIIINKVRGKTVNQGIIREISGGAAQVFAVDEWRLRDLSMKLYDMPAEQQKAYLSMLVYTLATAATLTKGDLPVFVVSKQSELVAA